MLTLYSKYFVGCWNLLDGRKASVCLPNRHCETPIIQSLLFTSHFTKTQWHEILNTGAIAVPPIFVYIYHRTCTCTIEISVATNEISTYLEKHCRNCSCPAKELENSRSIEYCDSTTRPLQHSELLWLLFADSDRQSSFYSTIFVQRGSFPLQR